MSDPAVDPAPAGAPAPEDFTHFAGFDWAGDHHDLAVVDRAGAVVLQFRFDDTAEGWQSLAARFAASGIAPGLTAVAVETSAGPAVQRLLDLSLAVYPVNPMAARRYRERKAPAGAKDDRLDAWSLADALRLDGVRADGLGWRRLVPDDPIVQELRLLCRDEVQLIAQRTALVNQLRAALREYYPAALEAFDDWTRPHGWHLVLAFPTPAALAAGGRRRWERFLKQHGLNRPETREHRLACFARAAEFCSSNPAVTAAKSRLAAALATMLLALQGQLDEYRRRIVELFDRHPDRDLFGSLPGAGGKLAPRLLAELGADRARFDTAQSLQCFAGTAPVSFSSGRVHRVKLRRACNRHLRAAVHLWADLSRPACAWARDYYQRHRDRGQSHACALRCLGQRWLKILWAMWQRRTGYDEARHLADRQRYGRAGPVPLAAGGGAK